MCGGAVIADYVAPSWTDQEKIGRRPGKSSWRSNGVFDCSIDDFESDNDTAKRESGEF